MDEYISGALFCHLPKRKTQERNNSPPDAAGSSIYDQKAPTVSGVIANKQGRATQLAVFDARKSLWAYLAFDANAAILVRAQY